MRLRNPDTGTVVVVDDRLAEQYLARGWKKTAAATGARPATRGKKK